jgi:hypothetical protein
VILNYCRVFRVLYFSNWKQKNKTAYGIWKCNFFFHLATLYSPLWCPDWVTLSRSLSNFILLFPVYIFSTPSEERVTVLVSSANHKTNDINVFPNDHHRRRRNKSTHQNRLFLTTWGCVFAYRTVYNIKGFFFHWLYSPCGPWPLISLLIYHNW